MFRLYFKIQKKDKIVKNKIGICLPSILDEKLIDKTTSSIKENIIDKNPETMFSCFINIDNYMRPGGSGTLESVRDTYFKNLKSENSEVEITITGQRLGLNLAYGHLLSRAHMKEVDYTVFFDDDHFIVNPFIIDDIYEKLIENNIMLHLSCGKKEADTSFSYESNFIENNEVMRNDTAILFTNNRDFYTLPGTFLNKSQSKTILENVDFYNRRIMIEDLVPKTLGDRFYQGMNLCTAFANKPGFTLNPGEQWCTPVEYHFAYDSVRACSGLNGVDLQDYNP
jgi:hypothetical protein